MTDEEDVRPDDAAPDRPAATPAPGPLTPARPWLDDDAPGGRSRVARPTPARPGAAAAEPRTGRAFLEAPPDHRVGGPQVPPSAPLPGLAPIRPWASGGTADAPSAARTPRPSNPGIVLQELAAELAPERRVETDEELRRRFARQHAAADGARLAALPDLTDAGPPPPSYEPDPAVYDVADGPDDTPRTRRFGRGRRGRTAPAEAPGPVASTELAAPSYDPEPVVDTAPVVGPVGVAEPVAEPVEGAAATARTGPLGRLIRWLLHRAPVPGAGDDAVRRGERFRRRSAADDDEGPFFPPEPTGSTVDPTPTPVPPSAAPAPPEPAPIDLGLPSVASVLDDVPLPAASEVPAVPVSRNRPRPRPPAPVDPPSQPSADTPAPPPVTVTPAPQRPRPRPAAARAAASPVAETSTEPDPAGSTALAPSPAGSGTDDASGYRSPDISRYLAAEEPAPVDGTTTPSRRFGRRARRVKDDSSGSAGGRSRLRGSRALRTVTRLLIVVVIAVAAAVVLRTYVVAPYYIPSASMEPTLKGGGGTNDRILVDKITYHVHDPHQGDIVVFDRPDTWTINDKTLVKRIIGLPGDIVSLRKGLVYVNGMRLTENYFTPTSACPGTEPLTRVSRWTVPMGDYFVMGDNRCNSEDSRMFGPVPDSKIVGRVFLIVWPVSRFGTP